MLPITLSLFLSFFHILETCTSRNKTYELGQIFYTDNCTLCMCGESWDGDITNTYHEIICWPTCHPSDECPKGVNGTKTPTEISTGKFTNSCTYEYCGSGSLLVTFY